MEVSRLLPEPEGFVELLLALTRLGVVCLALLSEAA